MEMPNEALTDIGGPATGAGPRVGTVRSRRLTYHRPPRFVLQPLNR